MYPAAAADVACRQRRALAERNTRVGPLPAEIAVLVLAESIRHPKASFEELSRELSRAAEDPELRRAVKELRWRCALFDSLRTAMRSAPLNATANVPGAFGYTPAATTVLDAGDDQVLSVDFTPTDDANWNSVLDRTTAIDVAKADQTITFARRWRPGPEPASTGSRGPYAVSRLRPLGSGAGRAVPVAWQGPPRGS